MEGGEQGKVESEVPFEMCRRHTDGSVQYTIGYVSLDRAWEGIWDRDRNV